MAENVRAEFLAAVIAKLGPHAVSVDDGDRKDCATHTLPAPEHLPPAILYPASTEEIQAIVRLANTYRVPLFPISMGQNIGLGSRAPVGPEQVVVELGRRMNRIVEVNDELGYCVIEPGVSFRAMHEELTRRGSSLMISPTAGPPDGSLLGNAIDKGGGAGAYGDHFGNVCGMEIVLGNGDIIRTGDGSLDVPHHPNWHVTKYSFGPALDGLFTQSNFGIVARIGMWLMQRPPVIEVFFFTFPDDEDLAEIIDLIRPLKSANVVPTLIRATNDLYLLASQERHPQFDAGSQRQPLSDGARAELRRKHRIGSWTVSGALYGASEVAIAPTLARLREHFCRSGKARYIPPAEAESMPMLRAALNSNRGIPADGELRMLDWRPGRGAIWLTPGAPMVGTTVDAFQRQCRRIAREHGLEYMASFVGGVRFARGVHAIIFDRRDPDEARRADGCYRAMCEVFRDAGVFVGRAPTAYQDYHQRQRTAEVVNACAAIKRALDPNGIIAPGRYGIS